MSWPNLLEYGPWGLLTLVVFFVFYLVLFGKLETATRIDRERAGDREQIARLQAANATKDEALKTYAETMPQILQYMAANNHFLDQFQSAAEKKRQGGGS